MSIYVSVNGNPVSIRRSRVVLSDLDQIKKNERDRRRRLRLEQVRQQSKEISNRLLERAKNVAKQELNKLEKDGKSQLKGMHDQKILWIQQKYQEEMEDIGQGHVAAALLNSERIEEPDAVRRKNKLAALKRAKEAMQEIKEAEKHDDPRAVHQERLRKVRELENMRSSLVAKLPKTKPLEQRVTHDAHLSHGNNIVEEHNSTKIYKKWKVKKLTPKKSSRRVLVSPRKSPVLPISPRKKTQQIYESKPGPSKLPTNHNIHSDIIESQEQETNLAPTNNDGIPQKEVPVVDSAPRKEVPVLNCTPCKADKVARYNPEDYTQNESDSSSNGGSTSASDDSSYFSDSTEQSKNTDAQKHHTSFTSDKVQLYDHSTRQRNVYDKPLGVVERIDIRNEPNAVDAARDASQVESVENVQLATRMRSAQRRGEDALLRDKVRRDYQTLIQNLDHLAREERKLKASQIVPYPTENVYSRELQRKSFQESQQRKMSRAFKAILNNSCTPSQYANLTESIITLPPQHAQNSENVPNAKWEVPPFSNTRAEACGTCVENTQPLLAEEKLSYEEQILDMLKKVERQKQLLLREFGADLPPEILNASLKSFSEVGETSVIHSNKKITSKPLSPEIQVINMSKCDEEDKVLVSPRERSVSQRSEMGVQTSTPDKRIAEDKSIQVELMKDMDMCTNNISPTDDALTQVKHHPLEPKVTIITPEVEDSSNESVTSLVTGVIIDIDNDKVKVTPKKKKCSTFATRRTISRVNKKFQSTSSTKTTSLTEKPSKSLPGSGFTSPTKNGYSLPTTPNKRIDICLGKIGLNVKVNPVQHTNTVTDINTETSQLSETLSSRDTSESVSRPYYYQAESRKVIKIRDTSDTSTSFASPPPGKPRSMVDAFSNSTSILEMLDSSGNETIKTSRRNISPVSTPETPSPRTIMMPSNVPHPDRINKMLKYASIDSETDTSILPTRSASTQHPDCQQQLQTSHFTSVSMKKHVSPSKICKCKNPQCRLLHTHFNDIENSMLKNCPEILKKYEDLQNMCTERIASLTNLITKVRNEQKVTGMDFSLINDAAGTNFMQFPSPEPIYSDLHSVRKLVENIETIHSQLAQTLLQSQRLIQNEATVEMPSSRTTDNKPITLYEDMDMVHKDKAVSTEGSIEDAAVPKLKRKPRIISEEKVNIKLNHLKIHRKPCAATSITTGERSSWPPSKAALCEENLIEELSKEILEQTTRLDKLKCDKADKTNNDELQNKNLGENSISSKKQNNHTISKQQEKDFIPLLAGIPKIPRSIKNTSSVNDRCKPPVTLHNGPYRAEIGSPGHELSTIVEFDTPDTGNKSHTVRQSPISKRCKSITTESPCKTSLNASVGMVILTSKSTEPSIDTPAIPTNDIMEENSTYSSTSSKNCLCKSSTPCDINNQHGEKKQQKNLPDSDIVKKNNPTEFTNSVPEKSNKQLQCGTSCHESVEHGSSLHQEANHKIKEKKDEVTSTSSNSFSGLSGISEITSTPSDVPKCASSFEEMEIALRKMGLGWAVTTLKKTKEASALSSSSNSDVTPLNTARRTISPSKKQPENSLCCLPDLSDLSSISIKEASKSTEQAFLKGRTSTPKMQNSNSNTEESNLIGSIGFSSDSLTHPNMHIGKTRPNETI